MEYLDAACVRRKVKRPELPVRTMQAQLGNSRRDGRHWPGQWHSQLFSHLQEIERLAETIPHLAGELPDRRASLRMEDNRAHDDSVSNLRLRLRRAKTSGGTYLNISTRKDRFALGGIRFRQTPSPRSNGGSCPDIRAIGATANPLVRHIDLVAAYP